MSSAAADSNASSPDGGEGSLPDAVVPILAVAAFLAVIATVAALLQCGRSCSDRRLPAKPPPASAVPAASADALELRSIDVSGAMESAIPANRAHARSSAEVLSPPSSTQSAHKLSTLAAPLNSSDVPSGLLDPHNSAEAITPTWSQPTAGPTVPDAGLEAQSAPAVVVNATEELEAARHLTLEECATAPHSDAGGTLPGADTLKAAKDAVQHPSESITRASGSRSVGQGTLQQVADSGASLQPAEEAHAESQLQLSATLSESALLLPPPLHLVEAHRIEVTPEVTPDLTPDLTPDASRGPSQR